MTAAPTENPTQAPETFYLKDYTPFGFEVESVELTFRLHPSATRVLSRIRFVPKANAADPRFFLHGEKLKLISARIDGEDVSPEVTPQGLSCVTPDHPFLWEAEVEIDPAGNTALGGALHVQRHVLHPMRGRGLSQDHLLPRPPRCDGTFRVRIEARRAILLSNGNPVSKGDGVAEWHDPWPKPAYLFALVAGDLVNHPDTLHHQIRAKRLN